MERRLPARWSAPDRPPRANPADLASASIPANDGEVTANPGPSACPRVPATSARQIHADEDVDMPHVLIVDPTSEVAIQPGAVVSKVVHRGDGMNVTVFAFDAAEELTEHQAARAAVVQVLSGRLRFAVDGEELELVPGSWLQMTPGTPHSLVAVEPTVMLLTLVGS